MKLADAPLFKPLRVTHVDTDEQDAIARRLLELGFITGSIVELRHEGPILNDPIAVLVRGMVVALRRYEAALVSVDVVRETTV